MIRWVEGRVIGQKAWTSTLYSLYVQAPIEPFAAGQFTQIGVKINKKIIYRPYSFVNSPEDTLLEFYYIKVPRGEMTSLLSQQKEHDSLYVASKASGRFTLEYIMPAEQLWLFATGTGLGVFLSLLRTSFLWENFTKIVLIHSVRYQAELSHRAILEEIIHAYPSRFSYIPVVTREKISGIFDQRFSVLLKNHTLEKKVGFSPTLTNAQFMLCGSPVMIKDVTSLLEERGFILKCPGKKGQITIENYWKKTSEK